MRNTAFFAAILTICIFMPFFNPASAQIEGDINGDHKITLQEAIYALQVVSGLQPQPQPAIDKEEVEPNGEQDIANLIPENAVIKGNIGSGDDEEDWYVINMPENGLFQYSIENLNETGTEHGIIGITNLYKQEGLDLVELNSISVYHGSAGSYIAPGELPISSYTAVAGKGTYYIKIPKYADHTAPYKLKTSFKRLETTDFGESNQLPEESQEIQETETVTALIGYDDDEEDWYKITPSTNGLLQFTIENLHPPESGIDQGIIGIAKLHQRVGLDLIELSSISIYHGSAGSYTAPGEKPISAYTAVSAGGEYFIQIPKYQHNSAPYELKTVFEQLVTTDMGEPNDSSTDSHKILEDGMITALIGYDDDKEDWYEITPSANGLLQLSIENLHPAESGIDQGIIGVAKLHQKVGLDLIELSSISIYHGSAGSYIAPGEMPTSAYTVVSGSGAYFLQIPKQQYNSAPYDLRTTFVQSEIADTGESNNSSDGAIDIQENGTTTAMIGYGDDNEDWYRITISENGSFQFELENLLNSTSEIDQGVIGVTYLYKQDGLNLTEVASISVYHGSAGSYFGPGESAKSNTISVSAGGIYFIKIPKYPHNAAPYILKTSYLAD